MMEKDTILKLSFRQVEDLSVLYWYIQFDYKALLYFFKLKSVQEMFRLS